MAGLTSQQAAERQRASGRNTIEDNTRHPVRMALSKLWGPVPWMLETAIVLQLITGEYAEAGVVASLLLFNGALGYVQQSRAATTLDTLTGRLALEASVNRDGTWQTILAADLVVDDLVTLSLGTVVPADVRILDGTVLVDESTLTGESVAQDVSTGGAAYAGALIKRGEAHAVVTAIGANTRFGRGAELVASAHIESTEQKAIFRVVRNLALFNGGVTVLLTSYAFVIGMPLVQVVPLVLIALLASIPVALPSMFTLAGTIGARALGRRGVLPTRLSALDEAAGVDVLCADKTGTLTMNSLAVADTVPGDGFTAAQVLQLGALASSTSGADPVDAAVRSAATAPSSDLLQLERQSFTPFDPSQKWASATVRDATGAVSVVTKGAYSVIADLVAGGAGGDMKERIADEARRLEEHGERVLAVAFGPERSLKLAGLVGLSDPPRPDSAPLVKQLSQLGVRTVMVTGDAPATAAAVAHEVGIEGAVRAVTPIPPGVDIEQTGVYSGVLPEDKFSLVKQLQATGHIVAMCGDGVNDAPALRQAQMGIAVSTATDAAKSAAGVVLTEPGLAGVIATIEEGRSTFQRILTFTLRSVIHKVVQVLFLFVGLIITGGAILTPVLMVLMMILGDMLAMSSSTDNVRPSSHPNVWRIGNLTLASIVLGLCDLGFCVSSLLIGHFVLGLDLASLQTMVVVTLVFSGQAVFYVARTASPVEFAAEHVDDRFVHRRPHNRRRVSHCRHPDGAARAGNRRGSGGGRDGPCVRARHGEGAAFPPAIGGVTMTGR